MTTNLNIRAKAPKRQTHKAKGERFPGPEKDRVRFHRPVFQQRQDERSREGEDGSSANRGSFSLVWLWRRMQQQQQQLWRIAGEGVAYV
jgi:hypothetical protein